MLAKEQEEAEKRRLAMEFEAKKNAEKEQQILAEQAILEEKLYEAKRLRNERILSTQIRQRQH